MNVSGSLPLPVADIMNIIPKMAFDLSITDKKLNTQLFVSSIKQIDEPNLVSIHSAIMDFGRLLLVLPYSVKCSCLKISHYVIIPETFPRRCRI